MGRGRQFGVVVREVLRTGMVWERYNVYYTVLVNHKHVVLMNATSVVTIGSTGYNEEHGPKRTIHTLIVSP